MDLEVKVGRLIESGQEGNLKEILKQEISRLGLMLEAEELRSEKGNAAALKYFQEKKEEFSHSFFKIPSLGVFDREPPRLPYNAPLSEMAKYRNRQESRAHDMQYQTSLARKSAACGLAITILPTLLDK